MNEIPIIEYRVSPSRGEKHSHKSRDDLKLLVYRRADESLEHKMMHDLSELLSSGDVLVFNYSEIFFIGKSARSDQLWKIRLISEQRSRRDTSVWDVSVSGPSDEKVRPGEHIRLPNDVIAKVQYPIFTKRNKQMKNNNRETQRFRMQFPVSPDAFREYIDTCGRFPGFAETNLIDTIRKRGIHTEYVTIYSVSGSGSRHCGDEAEVEHVVISPDAASKIMCAKREGKHIVAIGSAVVRALESSADKTGTVHPINGDASLFLVPGYEFRVVNALLAPFYPSRSLSLLPVAAIMGSVDSMVAAYQEATDTMYQFSRSRDIMLII